jgi:hypothetical protein
MRPTLFHCLTFVALTLTPTWGFAHALHVDCKVRGGKIEVEAFYDDDTAAAKAKVQVVEADGQVVAHGFTDQAGRWSCPSPAAGKYEVRVDAGAGHRAMATIDVPVPAPNPTPEESGTNADTETDPAIDGSDVRRSMIGVPWLKVAIGLFVIGGLSGAFLLASKLRKNGPEKPEA